MLGRGVTPNLGCMTGPLMPSFTHFAYIGTSILFLEGTKKGLEVLKEISVPKFWAS